MRAESEEEPIEMVRDDLCCKMIELITRIGSKSGVNREDLEDCALSFVEHMLRKAENGLHYAPPPPESWLYRCAENWVHNEWRRQRRQAYRESLVLLNETPSYRADDYMTSLLRQEFFDRLFMGVFILSPANQRLFVSFYLMDHSCQEIADATGRTENAIRQALWALRVRLRKILETQGLTEAEASDYLRAMTPSVQEPCL